MVTNRTKSRHERRELINKITNGFLLLLQQSDERLEVIPIQKLRNINLDVADFIKWARPEHRYVSEPIMCPFDDDATVSTNQKNENVKER